MDWKIFFSTFAAVFLAEVGDKTQLAAVGLSAQTRKPFIIFLAASLALMTATGIGVLIGDALFRIVPEFYITRGAAALFIAIGILLWFRVL
jgi:putative Ca2+/H+ antiporter (TMEM165/GDT1 family)